MLNTEGGVLAGDPTGKFNSQLQNRFDFILKICPLVTEYSKFSRAMNSN